MRPYDVAVIGAGPAGMAAAIESDRAGLSTVVLDEQGAPGGQIYRTIEQADARRLEILGPDYAAGAPLAEAFRSSGVDYLPGATVWNATRDRHLDYSRFGQSSSCVASAIVVASGAMERAMPLPGWTLPGVVTAGACQILLKAHGLIEDDVVFVGSGPLLWLVAAQMIAVGVKPKAIIETVPRSRYVAALPKLKLNGRTFKYLRKGAAMMFAVRRAGVPIFRDATNIAIEGELHAEAVTFQVGGRTHRIEARRIALHQGVVPNQQLTRLLRCEHEWNASQRCFTPVLDSHGETSVANVFVAGDGGGIGGARAATLQGRIAALRIAETRGKPVGDRLAMFQDDLDQELSIRPFLETLYAPSAEILSPADDTMICRCEELTAGRIRAAIDLGAPGPNQIKSLRRSGMGPCQGRICGLAVVELIAARRGTVPSPDEYYRIRPPIKPLALAELAVISQPEQDIKMIGEGHGA